MWAWLWGAAEEEEEEEQTPKRPRSPARTSARLAPVEQTRADEVIMSMPRADVSVAGFQLLVRPTRRSRKQRAYALLEGRQLRQHCREARGSVEWLALRDPDAFWSLAWLCARDIVDMQRELDDALK